MGSQMSSVRVGVSPPHDLSPHPTESCAMSTYYSDVEERDKGWSAVEVYTFGAKALVQEIQLPARGIATLRYFEKKTDEELDEEEERCVCMFTSSLCTRCFNAIMFVVNLRPKPFSTMTPTMTSFGTATISG